jgi:hemerythrin superfamily protein
MHQGEIDCTMTVLAADLFRADLQLRGPQPRLTLAEHLRSDHARIDGLLTELQHFLRVGALAEADQHFAALDKTLSRHMAAEEELLFPAMQRMTEAVARAVPGMLAEHGELRALLPDLAEALAKQDVLASEALLPQLRRSLARHHEDEEHLVYPISDWALSPDEQEALVKRLRGD